MPISRKKSLDASQARACLEAAAQSGLTRTQWALVHRVDPRALDAWHARLQQPGREVPTADVRMVEMVPADEPAPEPVRYVVRCGTMAVEVDHRFDDGVLRRLLAVVASC